MRNKKKFIFILCSLALIVIGYILLSVKIYHKNNPVVTNWVIIEDKQAIEKEIGEYFTNYKTSTQLKNCISIDLEQDYYINEEKFNKLFDNLSLYETQQLNLKNVNYHITYDQVNLKVDVDYEANFLTSDTKNLIPLKINLFYNWNHKWKY